MNNAARRCPKQVTSAPARSQRAGRFIAALPVIATTFVVHRMVGRRSRQIKMPRAEAYPCAAVKRARPFETSVVGASKVRVGKGLDRFLRECTLRSADEDGLAGFGVLHPGHEADLVGRTPARLAAVMLSTEAGVDGLHAPGELPGCLAQPHDLNDLVLEHPGRRAGVKHPIVQVDVQVGGRALQGQARLVQRADRRAVGPVTDLRATGTNFSFLRCRRLVA